MSDFTYKIRHRNAASLVRKVEATATSGFFFLLLCFLLANILFFGTRHMPSVVTYLQHFTSGQRTVLLGAVSILLPLAWLLYDGTSYRATYGMQKRRIRFADADDEKAISNGKTLLRIAVGILVLPLFPISWVMAITDEHRRTLADRLCKTVVWNIDYPDASLEELAEEYEIRNP